MKLFGKFHKKTFQDHACLEKTFDLIEASSTCAGGVDPILVAENGQTLMKDEEESHRETSFAMRS